MKKKILTICIIVLFIGTAIMQVGASQGIIIQKNENKTQMESEGEPIIGPFDYVHDIAIDSNDDVILVGDYFVKLDGDNGSILWKKMEFYKHVEIDSSDDIIGATSVKDNFDSVGYKVAKYDTNGNMIYVNIYNKLNYGYLTDLSIDSNDNVVLTGYVRENTTDPWKTWTIKVDGETGDILAESDLASGRSTALITVDSEDNIILIGSKSVNINNNIRITKFNNNLEKQWILSTNYTNYVYYPYSVTTDSEDNIIVCGSRALVGDPNYNFSYFTVKFDKNGLEVWNSPVIYDVPVWDDEASDVTVDSQDNIIITGDTGSDGANSGYREWHNIKYDKDGNKLWHMEAGSAINFWGGGVATDSADNIIFSGMSFQAHYCYRYLTIKCNENGVKLWTSKPDFGDAPNEPSISGMVHGTAGVEYTYTIVSTDPDGDDVYYYVEWGDGNNSGWVGPYASGEEAKIKHTWQSKGEYEIRAKAKDEIGHESYWWGYLDVTMPRNQVSNNPILKFLQDHPVLSQFLQLISQNMKTNLFP